MSHYLEAMRRQYPRPWACKLWGHVAPWGDQQCWRCELPVWLWPTHGGGLWGWLASRVVKP
jgi:hypothetical protein